MGKPTPGPWRYVESDNAIMATTDRDRLIAIPQSGAVGMQQRHANARLIAAAPDLLAALEQIARGITPDLDTRDCEALRGIASAAIAKATGEA